MIDHPFILVLTTIFLLSGCASGGGSYALQNVADARIDRYQNLAISVKPINGVELTPSDADRISRQISEAIMAQAPERFLSINAQPPTANTLAASVNIKNYDEGNAFARLMLAGLGQMHIDADLVLSDLATQKTMAQYEVSKTFAWGGAYGSSTSLRDIEVGFCKAAADAILDEDRSQ